MEVELRKEYKNSLNINIIEKTGISLQKKLQTNNPFAKKHCGEKQCLSCDGKKSIKCRKQGVGYDFSCKECKKVRINSNYIGETGRNGFTRGKEHREALKNKNEKNALYKHWKNCHEKDNETEKDRIENFKMTIKESFPDPLSRQVNEGVKIKRFEGNLLNSKAEWNMPPVIRINVENETKTLQKNQLNLQLNTIKKLSFQYRSHDLQAKCSISQHSPNSNTGL